MVPKRTVWWKRPWMVVLTFLFVGWLVFLTITWEKTRYHPTGDALFDKTAVLLLAKYSRTRPDSDLQSKLLIWFTRHRPSTTPNKPYYEEIRKWEEQFGDDPRYWQLRRKADLLAKKGRGYHLTEYSSEYGTRYALCFSKMPDIPRTPADFAQIDFQTSHYADEVEPLRILDLAIASDPTNSYFYYKKGDVLFWLEHYDLVLAEYVKGNAAENNYLPLGFPEKELLEHRDKMVSSVNQLAAVLMYSQLDAVESKLTLDRRVPSNEAKRGLILGGDLACADVLWKRAQRMGQMQNATPFLQFEAAVMIAAEVQFVPSPLTYADPADAPPGPWLVVEDKLEKAKHLAPYLALDPVQKREQQFYQDFSQLIGGLHKVTHPIPFSPPRRASSSMILKSKSLSKLHDEGKFIAQPQSYWNLSHEDLMIIHDSMLRDPQAMESARSLFDLLDPPPFEIWAAGGTTGVLERAEALGFENVPVEKETHSQ